MNDRSEALTSLRTGSENSREVERLSHSSVSQNVITIFVRSNVAHELEETELVVNDEQNGVILVDALKFECSSAYNASVTENNASN